VIKVTYKIKYKNSSLELLGRIILWMIGMFLIIPIPWVINDQIAYFSKGFVIKGDGVRKSK
jgi:hypothetical protein